MIDEVTLLRTAFEEPHAPSASSKTLARARLMEAVAAAPGVSAGAAAAAPTRAPRRLATGPRRRFWLVLTGAATATLAALVAIAAALVAGPQAQLAQPTQPAPAAPDTASTVLLKAAATTRALDFTEPRPDQWTFIETRGTRTGHVLREWQKVDGTANASIENGELVIHEDPAFQSVFPPRDYASLAALPTEAAAILDWLREPRFVEKNGRKHQVLKNIEEHMFSALAAILRNNVLPPENEAAIYEALALLPGVTLVEGATAPDGHPAVAVREVADGWYQTDLLLDPTTYRFIGEVGTVLVDHVTEPDDAGHTESFQAGDVELSYIRTQAKFVNNPGDL